MRDAAAGLGLLSIAAGCWLIAPALLVVGSLLLAARVWGHLRDGSDAGTEIR